MTKRMHLIGIAAAAAVAAPVLFLSATGGQAAPGTCQQRFSAVENELGAARSGIDRERAADLLSAAVRSLSRGEEETCLSQIDEAMAILAMIEPDQTSTYSIQSQKSYHEQEQQRAD